MKNETLIIVGKDILKSLLSECTEGQQLMFKRMYSADNLDRDLDEVVDNIQVDKIDHAITQCQRTVDKNRQALMS